MSSPNPDNDAAPGYCSVATAPLSKDQVRRVVQLATTGSGKGITIFSEKSLVGKGTRQLFLVDNNVALVEYAGVRKAKFVSKDAERYESMVAKALESVEDEENIKKVVLLAADGTICRRNTLPRLHRNSIIVMRCPSSMEEADEDDDDSSTSSE